MFRSISRLTRTSVAIHHRHSHNFSKGFWKNFLEPETKQPEPIIDLESVQDVTIRPMFPTTKLPQLAVLNFTYTIEKQCTAILDNSKSLFITAYDREQRFREISVEELEQLPVAKIINELDKMHAIFLRHDLHCAIDYFSSIFRDDAMAMKSTMRDERINFKHNVEGALESLLTSKDEFTRNANFLSMEIMMMVDDRFYWEYRSYLDFLVVQVDPAIITLAKNINTMTTILSNTSLMVTQTHDVELGLQVLDGLIDRWNMTEFHRRQALTIIKQGLDKSVQIRGKMLKKL